MLETPAKVDEAARYALAQFESLYLTLFVFACLNIIQFAIGSYVEPRVAGKALSLSPFLVLFSVFLWMFLWGLFGAFIGVPIAIEAAESTITSLVQAITTHLAR